MIGAAAGLLSGLLPANRITIDCDVVCYTPCESRPSLEAIAAELAKARGWAPDWLNSRVMELDVLPAGWQSRRRLIGEFGHLTVYALGRLDLVATKFFASRPQDRADIRLMGPTADELYFVRRYLEQMRLPRQDANLDDLGRAMAFLAIMEQEASGHA